MITSILQILGAGLSLWEHEAKTKYAKKYYKLQKEFYEEANKDKPDHAVLDELEFDIMLLGKSFASEIGEQAIKDL